jgi:glycerate kinase
MNVLVVPDKFKGTLTAYAAAELIASGWRNVRPRDHLEILPMSDGGDGFGEVLARLLDVKARTTATIDAAHRPRDAQWWWQSKKSIAIIESAQVIGLALLPPKRFHPFQLDTVGLGLVIQAALSQHPEQILIGIGGSATNDGGFGLARSLGWKFLDGAGRKISAWTKLESLHALVEAPGPAKPCEIAVAVDVQNPLLGPSGASRIYGPQKGLRPQDMALAEACLRQLARVTGEKLGLPQAAEEPGSGAAGGLGFGLRCFLKARLQSGFALFAQAAQLEDRIRASDLVITGEGAIDSSTLMGKGVGEVASLCQRHGVPCLGLAGTLELPQRQTGDSTGFARTYGIVPQLTTPEAAQGSPNVWLPRLAAKAAEDFPAQNPLSLGKLSA